jgi:hypothetical protein
MGEFLDKARGLARNPLGIIALFIALIYGFATLLLGAAAEKLSCAERLPLVWFVVLFPVLVLGVFYLLVTRHHWKLYAPGDYKADESFLKALTPEQQDARIKAEIESLHPEMAGSGPMIKLLPDTDTSAPAHGTSQPAPTRALDALRSRLILAERLALKKIQRDRGLQLKTQVAFGNDPSSAFDAVAQSGNSFVAVEVKLLTGSWTRAEKLREVLYRAMVATNLLRQRFGVRVEFRLLLVFVIESGEVQRSRLARLIEPVIKDAPFPVEWEIYKLSDLEEEFRHVNGET